MANRASRWLARLAGEPANVKRVAGNCTADASLPILLGAGPTPSKPHENEIAHDRRRTNQRMEETPPPVRAAPGRHALFGDRTRVCAGTDSTVRASPGMGHGRRLGCAVAYDSWRLH